MKFSLSHFLIFFLLFFSLSCQNSVPKGRTVQTKIIYDFEDEKHKPIQKLAFFLEMQSDVRRVDYINLYHQKSTYRWIIDNPLISKVNNTYYAGYTNCVVSSNSVMDVDNKSIPEGNYTVCYIDARGREFFSDFNLSYDKNVQNYRCSEFIKTLPQNNYSVFIGLYSKEGNLLFYDIPKEEWQVLSNSFSYNANSIFAYKNDVDFFRIFYEFENQVFVMPKIERNK